MKKFILPVISSIILFLFAEFIFYIIYVSKEYFNIVRPNKDINISLGKYLLESMQGYPLIIHKQSIDEKFFRPVQNVQSKEHPIMIFGCSYAYGFTFKNEESVSYILSKYSKRPIYNRAQDGWGIQHMLYQIENIDFAEIMKQAGGEYKPPKYLFYVLMDGGAHFYRMKLSNFPVLSNEYYISYQETNGKLVQRQIPFGITIRPLSYTYIYNQLITKQVEKDFCNKNPDLFNLFILHIKTINDLIKEKFGDDTKFIILTFEDTKKQMWQKQVEDMGIDVIDIAQTVNKTDLQNDKYNFFEPPECKHPNGRMWKDLIPKLKEKYPDL